MIFLSEVLKLLEDFVLLEYFGLGSEGGIGLVGRNNADQLVVASSFDTENKRFKEVRTINGLPADMIPVNSVTLTCSKTQRPERLILLKSKDKKSKGYTLVLQDRKERITKLREDLICRPIVISDPVDLLPLIGLSEDQKLKFYRLEGQSLVPADRYTINRALAPSHTSSFIDVTGDMRPNLVIVENKNRKNTLYIYDVTMKGSVQRGRGIPLPDKVGPILFADLKLDCSFAMIYVALNDNGGSTLNVHYNGQSGPEITERVTKVKEVEKHLPTAENTEVFSERPDLKIPLEPYFPGYTPIIETDHNTPGGLFLADLDLSGKKSIFITIERSKETIVKGFNLVDNKLVFLDSKAINVGKYSGIKSISVADLDDRGHERILINHVEDGRVVLTWADMKPNTQHAKLTLVSTIGSSKTDPDPRYIIGSTYLVVYEGLSKRRKAAQLYSTSYPSLQQQGSYIGLATANIFADFVYIRTNAENSRMKSFVNVRSAVIPNTSVVLAYSSGVWNLRSFYSLKRYHTVAVCVALLFVAILVISLFFAVKDRNAQKKAEAEDDLMKPLFTAL